MSELRVARLALRTLIAKTCLLTLPPLAGAAVASSLAAPVFFLHKTKLISP